MKARRCILILAAAMLASCATVPVWKNGAFETSEATEKTRRTKNGMIVEKKIPVGKVVRF